MEGPCSTHLPRGIRLQPLRPLQVLTPPRLQPMAPGRGGGRLQRRRFLLGSTRIVGLTPRHDNPSRPGSIDPLEVGHKVSHSPQETASYLPCEAGHMTHQCHGPPRPPPLVPSPHWPVDAWHQVSSVRAPPERQYPCGQREYWPLPASPRSSGICWCPCAEGSGTRAFTREAFGALGAHRPRKRLEGSRDGPHSPLLAVELP